MEPLALYPLLLLSIIFYLDIKMKFLFHILCYIESITE